MQTSRASLRLLVIASAVVFIILILSFRKYTSTSSSSSIDFSAPFGRLRPQPPIYSPPDTNSTTSTIPHSGPVGTKPRHCIDPYREQGLFYYQNNSQNNYKIDRKESRWIPYTDDFFNLEDPPQAEWPKAEDPVFDENSTPPQEWLDRSPRNWMKDLTHYIRELRKQSELKKNEDNNSEQIEKREDFSHIDWVRNKRVLLLGDSIMRMESEYLCQDTGGKVGCTEPHQYCWCTIPQLNFTVVMWHIPGMFIHHNATWWWMKNWRLVDFETRFEELHRPSFLRLFGMSGRSPDLILFETGLWDERAFRELAKSRKAVGELPDTGLASPRRHITWEETRFFSSRMKKFIPFIRNIFGPDVPMMYQSLTTHNISDGVDLAVFDLDRVSRFLTKKFELEVFEWSKIIRAHGAFWKDRTHPDKSPVSWLWGNMMFNYLFRALGGLEVDGRIERLPSKEFKGYGGWDECHSWNLLYN